MLILTPKHLEELILGLNRYFINGKVCTIGDLQISYENINGHLQITDGNDSSNQPIFVDYDDIFKRIRFNLNDDVLLKTVINSLVYKHAMRRGKMLDDTSLAAKEKWGHLANEAKILINAHSQQDYDLYAELCTIENEFRIKNRTIFYKRENYRIGKEAIKIIEFLVDKKATDINCSIGREKLKQGLKKSNHFRLTNYFDKSEAGKRLLGTLIKWNDIGNRRYYLDRY
jgi:hypothetical protein